ncbi:ArsR/SmtB family transcription factor [Methylobacillus pratensis]|uniref:ArsR/SmtB family transcription factor n=1 Tax=Methylobacillus sp. Pita1 TaxID=3382642 RepID=UPI0038B58733
MNTPDPQIIYSRFAPLAELAKTLGHPHRLTLLEHAANGEQAVERLAELTGLSIANASQHLQHLKRAGFVQTRRDGKHMLYRLGDGPVANILVALRDYAEFQQGIIRQVVLDSRYQRDNMEAISIQELVRRMADESIVLLDVRPDEEFAQGHLPGAVNIPLKDLVPRLGELPNESQIIAYCRDPYCVLSSEAVTILRENGLTALRLIGGVPEWKAVGLAVELSTTKA